MNLYKVAHATDNEGDTGEETAMERFQETTDSFKDRMAIKGLKIQDPPTNYLSKWKQSLLPKSTRRSSCQTFTGQEESKRPGIILSKLYQRVTFMR